MTTKIEWADETINPLVGCSRVSSACDYCYAIGMAHRHGGNAKLPQYHGLTHMTEHGPDWTGEVRWVGHVLPKAALRLAPVKKPLRIFHCSMSDIAHESATVQHLANVLAFAMAFPLHTHMLLTKRPHLLKERLEALQGPGFDDVWDAARQPLYAAFRSASWALKKRNGTRSTPKERDLLRKAEYIGMMCAYPRFPLPNVWLGTTIWDQASADRAVPILLNTPAAKRFVSVEPMLGPVGLRDQTFMQGDVTLDSLGGVYCGCTSTCGFPLPPKQIHGLDWVICGGETGAKARPMHPDWPRKLCDDCQAAGVPFFFKQWGEWAPDCLCQTKVAHKDTPRPQPGKPGCMFRCGTRRAGRALDGRTWEELPA